jgi:ribose transport system ATP-binding protein
VKKVLEVRNVVKEFPGVKALQGVDLDVVEGEVHCLLGPNGAGKSTLIKCVSGAIEPTAGEILFMGEPLPQGDPAGSLKRGVATIY